MPQARNPNSTSQGIIDTASEFVKENKTALIECVTLGASITAAWMLAASAYTIATTFMLSTALFYVATNRNTDAGLSFTGFFNFLDQCYTNLTTAPQQQRQAQH